MRLLGELFVPGVGPVSEALCTIRQLCLDMKEAVAACQRVHNRLEDLLDELEAMEREGRLPSEAALKQYVQVVAKFLRYLERYYDAALLLRVVEHCKAMEELGDINEEVAQVVEALDVAAPASWSELWTQDRRRMGKCLSALLENDAAVAREFQSSRARTEALFTLKFEVDRRGARNDAESLERMRAMVATIAAVGSRATQRKLPPWFVPCHERQFQRKAFACGSFGSVYRGVWRSGAKVVVKRVLMDDMSVSERAQIKMEKELDLLYQLNHANIIKMFGVSHVSSPAFIVCEEATNGDLGCFLARSEDNKKRMWRLLYQAALGLDYIHKKGIVHGDLKLNNILVGADGQAKLSDFGLSGMRILSNMADRGSTPRDVRWSAPERLKQPPTVAADVYSLAMCIIEAASGDLPYAFLGDDDIRENVRNGELPAQPEELSDDAWELVVSMTSTDPSARVPLQQVIDKLKTLASRESSGESESEDNDCDVCFSTISYGARFCSQCGAQVRAQTDEQRFERKFRAPSSVQEEPRYIPPPFTINSSVVDLMRALSEGNADDQERSLEFLLQVCLDDDRRKQLYEADGVPVLVGKVKHGRTHFIQAAALRCLAWITELDAKLPESEFDSLQACVPPASSKMCSSLVESLVNGTDREKLRAAMHCACIAEVDGSELLLSASVVAPLVEQLRTGDDTMKVWAMHALGNLADDSEARSCITCGGAISLVLKPLQSGTGDHKGLAAYVLGRLSIGMKTNTTTITTKENIACLVDLLESTSTLQRDFGAFALAQLSASDIDANLMTVASGGAIPPLVGLLRSGTAVQKTHAVAALSGLAKNSSSSAAIADEEVVPDLVALLRSGNDSQKGSAAALVSFLAESSSNTVAIVRQGSISALVPLLRSGTQTQKDYAVRALAKLGGVSKHGSLVTAGEGAISPLVELLRVGSRVQKSFAAATLGYIAGASKEKSLVIRHSGAIALLADLFKTGSSEQHGHAVIALEGLTRSCRSNLKAVIEEGVVPSLISMVRSGTHMQREFSATVLGRLANTSAHRKLIASAGAIPPLVSLLESGTNEQKEEASVVLGQLAINSDANKRQIEEEGGVAALENLKRSGTFGQRSKAWSALAHIYEEDPGSAKKRKRQDCVKFEHC